MRIGIPVYDQVDMLDVAGPYELFGTYIPIQPYRLSGLAPLFRGSRPLSLDQTRPDHFRNLAEPPRALVGWLHAFTRT